MSTRLTSLGKRAAAFAGAVALAAATLIGGAAAATAAPAGPGNVDFDAVGSIVVHKHEQPATPGQVGTGAELAPLPNPLAGVEFTVQQLDIDLTNPAAWDNLNAIDAENPGTLLGEPKTIVTDTEGIATFSGLPVGVYVVTEGADIGNNGIVTKAAPFIVVIPTAIDNTWTYDVHAYPKNSVSQLDKVLDEEADAAAHGQGDLVVWNITSTAPVLTPADQFNSYRITDQLDPRLAFQSVSNVMYNGVALEPADYTVTPAQAGTTGGERVIVELTATGLAKVKANSGAQLTFDLNTIVVGDIDNGIIPNSASQFTNVNGDESTIDSEEDETYWGNVNIRKQDAANRLALAGAEFQVFATEGDALAKTNPITVNGVDTFTTQADGTVVISSLNVGALGTSRDYWIVETAAPAGYVLDSAPRKVTVIPGANASVTYTVDNTKQDRPDLPLTGATGTAIFSIGGAALVALAVGFAARNRRQARA